MNKNDWILAGVLFLCAAVACIVLALRPFGSGGQAEVTVYFDGEELARYPLDVDRSVRIPSSEGKYNVLEIKEHKADITEATCPDKICVHQRPIGRTGETLVCLPNKVVVEIKSDSAPGMDGSTR